MAKPGPRKTPTTILQRQGSWRAKTRKDEPDAPPNAPECPERFDATERDVWDKFTRRLDAMGLLSEADENAIVRYCRQFVRWNAADATIKKHGEAFVIKNPDGSVKYVQQRPEVAIEHKLSTALLRLEQEFGLTPSARAGLAPPKNTKPANDNRPAIRVV